MSIAGRTPGNADENLPVQPVLLLQVLMPDCQIPFGIYFDDRRIRFIILFIS